LIFQTTNHVTLNILSFEGMIYLVAKMYGLQIVWQRLNSF